MSSRRATPVLLLLVAGAGLAAAVLVWGRSSLPDRKREHASRATNRAASFPRAQFPLTPVARSPYLNTRPEAQYVGGQACERCHPDTHQSYHATMMSRSMGPIDAAQEPADGEFMHSRSGRRYKIYRQGQELRLSETLTGVDDVKEVVLADHALKYVIGSGHFCRSYLSEIEGFLVEAPATWFQKHASWDMSPGYDLPFPQGFEREASEHCLYCHSGRVETLAGTLHKIKVHEAAIGCERCHGPGSLHLARWESDGRTGIERRPAKAGAIDLTIVNPAHLTRDLAEAVCQQCHLTSTAQAQARGRTMNDYRPGLPLQDFVISYRLQGDDQSMKVVGHYDQLVQSPCYQKSGYQKSGTLTCLSCHNPHDKPSLEARGAYYRSICLSCHRAQDCRVDSGVLASRAADNDCTKCHMPGVPTEIVHLAFTHHRIGVHAEHDRHADQVDSPTAELEPWHDLSRMTEIDRQRSLGLAYFARSLDYGPHTNFCLDRARELLEDVREQGLDESLVATALAAIASRTPGPQAAQLAAEALADPGLPATARTGLLYLLAADHYRNQRPDRAIELLQQLVRLRRNSADWALLGFCEEARSDPQAAIAAFEKALAINPQQLAIHKELARLYEAAGEVDKAVLSRRIEKRLQDIAAGAARGTRAVGPRSSREAEPRVIPPLRKGGESL